jgi:hypothetical protein
MKLLLVHTAELALLVAGWAYLGRLLRGADAETVRMYVSGNVEAFLPLAESLVAIAFTIIAVYWLALAIAEVRDACARRGTTKHPPTFPTSVFFVGVYLFILTCKVRGALRAHPHTPPCRLMLTRPLGPSPRSCCWRQRARPWCC